MFKDLFSLTLTRSFVRQLHLESMMSCVIVLRSGCTWIADAMREHDVKYRAELRMYVWMRTPLLLRAHPPGPIPLNLLS